MNIGLIYCKDYMKKYLVNRSASITALVCGMTVFPIWAHAQFQIESFNTNGQLSWVDTNGSGAHHSIQWASSVDGPWHNWSESMANFTGLGSNGTTTVPMFYRMVNPDPTYQTNATYSYVQSLPSFNPLTPLESNEMRVTFMGSMIPLPVRRAQAEVSTFVEVGWVSNANDRVYHGQALDQAVFDCGAGVSANYAAAVVGMRRLNKIFITHLHADHMSDLTHIYCFGPSSDRKTPLYVFGPGPSGVENPTTSGQFYDDGTSNYCAMLRAACRWHTESFSFQPTRYLNYQSPTKESWGLPVEPLPVGDDQPDDAYAMIPIQMDWTEVGGVAYNNQTTGLKITHYPVIHTRRGSVGYKLEWTPPGATNPLSLTISGDTKPETNSVNQACNGTNGVDLFIHEMVVPAEVWAYKNMGLDAAPTVGDPLYPSFTNTVAQLTTVQNSSHTPQGAFGYLLSQIKPAPRLAVPIHFPVADDTVQSALKSVQAHCPNIVMGKDIVWAFDLMVLRVFPDKIIQCRASVSDFAFNPPVQISTNGFYAPKYHNTDGSGDAYGQIDRSSEIRNTNDDGSVNFSVDGY